MTTLLNTNGTPFAVLPDPEADLRPAAPGEIPGNPKPRSARRRIQHKQGAAR